MKNNEVIYKNKFEIIEKLNKEKKKMKIESENLANKLKATKK